VLGKGDWPKLVGVLDLFALTDSVEGFPLCYIPILYTQVVLTLTSPVLCGSPCGIQNTWCMSTWTTLSRLNLFSVLYVSLCSIRKLFCLWSIEVRNDLVFHQSLGEMGFANRSKRSFVQLCTVRLKIGLCISRFNTLRPSHTYHLFSFSSAFCSSISTMRHLYNSWDLVTFPLWPVMKAVLNWTVRVIFSFKHCSPTVFLQKTGGVGGEELNYMLGAPLVESLTGHVLPFIPPPVPSNYTKAEMALSELLITFLSNFAHTG